MTEQEEPYEGRLSRTVPWERWGETPRRDPTTGNDKMKTTIYISLIFTLVTGCFSDQKKNKLSHSNKNDISYNFSVLDSFDKYQGKNKIFKYDSTKIFVGASNNIHYGFQQINDSTTVIYQKVISKWEITDTISFPFYHVEASDINGDHYQDLIITYGMTGAGGNSENICFIYLPTIKIFKHNKFYDLPNIHFEKSTNLVCSAWFSGPAHCQSKETYKIADDSLVFNLGIEYCPYENEKTPIQTIEYYIIKNGKYFTLKKIKSKHDNLYNTFATTFWDSRN